MKESQAGYGHLSLDNKGLYPKLKSIFASMLVAIKVDQNLNTDQPHTTIGRFETHFDRKNVFFPDSTVEEVNSLIQALNEKQHPYECNPKELFSKIMGLPRHSNILELTIMPMNNWNTFSQMYNYAKELHAFWSGVVPGTVHSPNNIIATLEFIKDFEAGDQFEYLKEGMRLSLENGVRDWEEFREKAKKDGLTLKEKSFQRDVDICNHYLSILRNGI